MGLKEDRGIDRIDEINDALLARIVEAINELDDGEFIDILHGSRGNLSNLPSGNGSFTLCDARCICGNVTNVPCQWLSRGEKCRGIYCEHFLTRTAT